MPLMNARHRKSKKWNKKFDSFDARSSLDLRNGAIIISVRLIFHNDSSLMSGYYFCCASIPFPEIECISKSCWDIFIGESKYTRDLPMNLNSLEGLWSEISAEKAEILYRIQDAELVQGCKRLPIVDDWLARVATAEVEVSKLIHDGPQQIQKLCLCGYCSKSSMTYKFGKEVALQLKIVQDLLATAQKESFKPLIGHQRLNQVDLRPQEPPIGLDSTFDRAWSCIQDANVGIIGLYGPGGVGKTTLLKQINNKFRDTGNFVVVWVVVSKGCNPEKLQEDIGKKIGFSDDSWKSKSYDEKAADISRMLEEKKFVLLLDDVWEHVNLTEMGIPIPNESNRSKIIFTTRSFQVCGQLHAKQKIMVNYLPFEAAFKLFCKMVGEDTLASDPKISELAKTVAKECAGLPLALITVARAMTGKRTTEEWDYAVECLQRSASEFEDIKEKVYSRMKFSYDNLRCEEVRSCFLYCCLFPEDFIIHKSDLIEYWNYEGFLGDRSEIFKRGRGFDIIGTLLSSCLLEKNDVKSVKMHDVTREMALWIAQEVEKDKHGFFVRSGSRLGKIPRIEEWKDARKVSLMDNEIEQLQEAPSCSHLLTLLLQQNRFQTINGVFFQRMPLLVILDLSENENLVELPSEISKLVSLEYLNVSCTGLRNLASGLNELIRLKYLNVERTNIERIPRKLISNLQKLQTLKFGSWISYGEEEEEEEVGLLEELESLEDLSTLTITISSNASFHKFQNSSKLQSCTTIELSLCNIKEGDGGEKLQDIGPSMRRFDNLHSVRIYQCNQVVDLTWLIFAPNVTRIYVHWCSALEEIINREKLGKNEDLNQLFAKLEELSLLYLPSLRSICKCALSFPHLEELYVMECPELKKLPINSSTAAKDNNKFTIICPKREWWEQLEWEDGATRTAFTTCCFYFEDRDVAFKVVDFL